MKWQREVKGGKDNFSARRMALEDSLMTDSKSATRVFRAARAISNSTADSRWIFGGSE